MTIKVTHNDQWSVLVWQVDKDIRAAAREKYTDDLSAFRASWSAGDRSVPSPQHNMDEHAWIATLTTSSGRVYHGGGSTRRVALQRAVESLCVHEER